MLNNHVLPKLGFSYFEEIRPIDLTEFFEGLRQKGLSKKYATNLYGMLKTIFDVAAEHDLIKGSPLRPKLHRPKYPTPKKNILTGKQIRQVLTVHP